MCLTIEDGLLSLLTLLSFKFDPIHFAKEMSECGLIPKEVSDDEHRLYKTGNHLKCRILQAVKDFVSNNEIVQVIKMLENNLYIYAGSGIHFMKDYLCKLLCVRGKGMSLIYDIYSTTSTISPNSTGISIS